MNVFKSFDSNLGQYKRKAARLSGGMESLNPCRWRGKRLHHHGGGVCWLFVLLWMDSGCHELIVCKKWSKNNLKMRLMHYFLIHVGVHHTEIELIMMALAAILAAQHFPRDVDDWEGLPLSSRTWAAWKTAFHLAHLKRQCQILASGRGEPLGRAPGVLPAAVPAIGWLKSALNNLALAAMNATAILQQLTAANLALTATVKSLTATNKKLVDAVTRKGKPAVTQAVTPAGGGHATRNPFPGNYCWTHGHRICKEHMSATCTHQAVGHRADATALNTLGGSKKDKG
jgi:hypothetical protein